MAFDIYTFNHLPAPLRIIHTGLEIGFDHIGKFFIGNGEDIFLGWDTHEYQPIAGALLGCMRHYLERTKSEISGWKNRPTKRPTAFMMTTKFLSILVARSGTQRQLLRPLKPVQLEFLQAMGVNLEVFVKP